MQNPVIKYALYGALAAAMINIVLCLFSIDLMLVLAPFLVFGLSIFLVIKVIKFVKDYQGGVITFGQGLKVGLLALLFTMLGSNLGYWLSINFIDPSALDILRQKAEEGITMLENMGFDELAETTEEQIDNTDFGSLAAILSSMLSTFLFLGVPFTMIVSLIMKSNEPRQPFA